MDGHVRVDGHVRTVACRVLARGLQHAVAGNALRSLAGWLEDACDFRFPLIYLLGPFVAEPVPQGPGWPPGGVRRLYQFRRSVSGKSGHAPIENQSTQGSHAECGADLPRWPVGYSMS